MHVARMLVSPASRRFGLDSTRVEVFVLRLPPRNVLRALEDNQSSASARTHPFGRAGAGFKVIIHDSDQCNTDPFEEVRYYTSSGQGLRIRAPDKLRSNWAIANWHGAASSLPWQIQITASYS
jgi:hypothetical protein